MVGLVVTFLLIGLVAAILGFGGIVGASFGLAKISFLIALLLLLLLLLVFIILFSARSAAPAVFSAPPQADRVGI